MASADRCEVPGKNREISNNASLYTGDPVKTTRSPTAVQSQKAVSAYFTSKKPKGSTYLLYK